MQLSDWLYAKEWKEGGFVRSGAGLERKKKPPRRAFSKCW